MSIARHHAEWLSLVPVSGPFLSLPVLLEVFNTGLEPHEPDHHRALRQEFSHWQEAQEKHPADPAPHHRWIKFILTTTLDLDDRVLTEGQAISQSLQVEVQQHHELLRPNYVVNDPHTNKPRLLIQTYPRSQDLTSYVAKSPWKASPDTRMTELLHGTGVRLGLVTNGEHWMLVDAPKGETTGYASWYASLWLEEPLTLRAFRSLLGANRFFNTSEEHKLETLLTKSASNQQEVTDQLGYQVRRAVEVLIQSLDKADQDFGRQLLADVPPEQLYESALTIMMRLVFLFCAEERELIPSKPFPVYDQNYSVSMISKQLRELADQYGEELLERRFDAWPRLLAAFRAVFEGLQHHEVHIPAYGGNLFHPDRFPFLEGRKEGSHWAKVEATPLPVNNRTVLHLLEALQFLEMKSPGIKEKTLRRISFKHLDIEQIGHVYEGLLDHTAKRALEPYLGLIGTRDQEPEIPLAELERLLAKGESELLKFLKEHTGKTENALKKALKAELDPIQTGRFRSACQSDEALWKRAQPLAGLVRLDSFEYPVVIPRGSVFVTAGSDRRSTGTHYTPRSLTEPIVQYTLEPLVYIGPAEGLPQDQWKLKPAHDLLELKICDMACGSGAFLVQAARYMAERLMEAWDQAKQANPNTPGITALGQPSTGKSNEALLPDDPLERKTYAMRLIAQRCLYGVDKNPLAAEMAKLSLWLLTLAKDKPFEFLDHAIRSGDSLVGIHNLDQLRYFSLKPEQDDIAKFYGPLLNGVEEAIALRLKLEETQANTIEDVERQEKLLVEANQKLARLKHAADLLVSAEFWGKDWKDKQERIRHAYDTSRVNLDKGDTEALEKAARKERRTQTMFHWPLEFPEVIVKRGGFDAFIGNPPFVGGRRIIRTFGESYQQGLNSLFTFISANADYCTFFFYRAFQATNSTGYLSYLATKTISEGDTKESGLDILTNCGSVIFRANSSVSWPGSANVLISLIFISKNRWQSQTVLNDKVVPSISNSLSAKQLIIESPAYHLAMRQTQVFQGCAVAGDGFLLKESEALRLIQSYTANSDVVRQYITGSTFCNEPVFNPTGWIIHFFDRSEVEAMKYTECFSIINETVRPYRSGVRREAHRKYWWQFGDKRPAMFNAITDLNRVLANARVSKYIAFDFLPSNLVYLNTLHIFPFEDFGHFTLLQSAFHESWALARISSVGITPQYTPVDCFGTFPFPGDNEIRILAEVGDTYHNHRKSVMSQNGLGLTATYNRFHNPEETSADIAKLRELHVEMDQAVAAAYGWSDLRLEHGFHETKQGLRYTISEPARREVLQRLLKLNHQRYAEEVQQGLHDKKKPKASKGKTSKKTTNKTLKQESTLFDVGSEESHEVWYFAYGSNLLRNQKAERTGPIRTGSERPQIARLADFRLAFNKPGALGGLFANIMPCPGDEVIGVVYRCTLSSMKTMDGFEGGYVQKRVKVVIEDGTSVDALTYVAEKTVNDGRPSDEYFQRIVTGARQHGLPEEYLEKISRFKQ